MKELLNEAITTGEILKVRYFGGSSPGQIRDISPIKIFDGKVRARCLISDAVKTFSINKMELVVDETGSSYQYSPPEEEKEYATAFEIRNDLESELTALGWVVQIEENMLTLHDKFKNGKIKKTPVVSIAFEEF